MRRFLIRRLAQGVATMFFVATLSFVLLHAAPGDPFTSTIDDPQVSEASRERMRREFGLDRPIPEQYVRWIGNLIHGELGDSFTYHRSVADVLADAIPNSLILMMTTLVASFVIGMTVGVVQATRRGKTSDRVLSVGSIVFASFPDFWLSIVMMLAFAYWIPLFPVGGMVDVVTYDYLSPLGKLLDRLEHLVLPAVTLTLVTAGPIARYQRSALLDVLPEEYLRTARAKGLSERRVMLRHALRNALGPIITALGFGLPSMIGGALFVEAVYSWPGMGGVAVRAVNARDYPVAMAVIMLGSLLVVAGSILSDVLHAVADPRLRSE